MHRRGEGRWCASRVNGVDSRESCGDGGGGGMRSQKRVEELGRGLGYIYMEYDLDH